MWPPKDIFELLFLLSMVVLGLGTSLLMVLGFCFLHNPRRAIRIAALGIQLLFNPRRAIGEIKSLSIRDIRDILGMPRRAIGAIKEIWAAINIKEVFAVIMGVIKEIFLECWVSLVIIAIWCIFSLTYPNLLGPKDGLFILMFSIVGILFSKCLEQLSHRIYAIEQQLIIIRQHLERR